MRNDRVSFTQIQRRDREDFRCRETGVCYSLESSRELDCYIVRNSGEAIGTRNHRHEALDLIEQSAALDFATAQAESAWTICDIELDCRGAV